MIDKLPDKWCPGAFLLITAETTENFGEKEETR